ncbi:Hypothetical Protein RSKD131_4207 [Cereibacter sphaeroides KD131]|nr:Hypothetical Protein RSKD131_4207 [Cereibacter sphaeroides KD131]
MGLWRIFCPSTGWKESADFYRAAQARDHSHTPSGPPEMS